MIFKVYYQEHLYEVPVREKTKSLFVDAESERDVRLKLKSRDINIEYVQIVEGAYLNYEKKHEDYKVLEI